MSKSGNTLLSEIPTLDEPLAMLAACHGRVRAFCNTLLRLADYLPEHGADQQAQQAARNILRYFDVAAPKHHADEEQDLFPALMYALADRDDPDAAALRTTIASLLAEHVELHGLWLQLRTPLIQIATGKSAVLPMATTFASRYQAHADQEEAEVFQAAELLLDAEMIEQISGAMTTRRRD
ncbi:hemerythrin domain-containing protein [Chitinivorax sp. B]|uniref:hemerythrin domain-containing protein n=1 Tax=Chitinivorax sp. B TaxID=2502235 RepID=UPI0020181FDB|nr:hemerythrin domain-containing protein [Chitinivorax sp. B]